MPVAAVSTSPWRVAPLLAEEKAADQPARFCESAAAGAGVTMVGSDAPRPWTRIAVSPEPIGRASRCRNLPAERHRDQRGQVRAPLTHEAAPSAEQFALVPISCPVPPRRRGAGTGAPAACRDHGSSRVPGASRNARDRDVAVGLWPERRCGWRRPVWDRLCVLRRRRWRPGFAVARLQRPALRRRGQSG